MDDLAAWRRPAPVVIPVPVDPTGRRGPTRGAARGRLWRRTSYGYYVPACVDGTVPEQRVAEAVPLLAPGGVVTGWGALRMMGVGFLDGRAADGRTLQPVTLTQGRGAPRVSPPGVRSRQDQVGEAVRIAGVPVHRPPRALVDEMRLAHCLDHAVVAADAVRAAHLASPADIEATLDACRSWEGIDRARRAWALSADGVDSPPETRLRLLCREVGLPHLLVNKPVFSRGGRLLGFPDLLDVEAGLALEYDGADHRKVTRQRRDNVREEGLRAHGLEVLRVTSLDLLQPEALSRRLLGVRARCPFLPHERRRWTLVAPPGWRSPRR